MPWDTIKLNDGRSIPSLAFGTGSLGNGQSTIDTVKQALGTGLIHIDTAQGYKNEQETGTALQQSGLKRDDLYITTKFSGAADIDIATSIRNSVNWLGVEYVDLYLIHSPRFAKPDIASAWKQLEKAQADGLTKSIGVSNFTVPDLKELLASAQVKPAANQIQLHPYVWAKQAPIVEFCQNNGIVVEAYSALIPLRRHQGGPVDVPVNKIARRLNAAPEQVLLAWAKAKGAVVITASRKKERLEGYLKAGDLELTADDVAAIDDAGKDDPPPSH